jgi:hypothetical protein
MSDHFQWEDPPPHRRAPRGYEVAAQRLRENPGRWARIEIRSQRAAAGRVAYTINAGKTQAWQEPGDFEAVSRAVGDAFHVYARYLGDEGHDDE